VRAALGVVLFLAACSGEETPDHDAATADAEAHDEAAKAEAPPPPKEIPAPDDVAAPPDDALTTESGLRYKVLKAGEGDKPGEGATVTVNYTGWTTDGKMFDSSVTRGREATFSLNQVIAGWTEGLQLIAPGGSARLWIPEELAYQGRPGKPAGMLVFDVDLIKFEKPPEAPADVAKAPADATKTKSGLAFKTLSAGTGTDHPAENATVTVHFSGWTAEGKLLQSTTAQGRPATVPLAAKNVPAGWTEGIQLMVKGEKARLWLPAELAKVPGAPEGPAVFDFELIDFKNAPATPPDVRAPNDAATKTDSGLYYKVLTPGNGEPERADASSRVTVNYTGWTTDGKMFDSSVQRGKPATFTLSQVIPGWTEGLQLMAKGEKTRFWIPEELAYKGRPGAPQGMLVFDVELLEIGSAAAVPSGEPAHGKDDGHDH